MEERRSDTEKTFGAEDPPAVSNQNGEEGPVQHGGERDTAGADAPEPEDEDKPAGASGEGSQSTGHPGNAG